MSIVKIPLSGPRGEGLFALVDADQADSIAAHRWNASTPKGSRTIYARRVHDKKTVLMHRMVMNALAGDEVDHIDGNGLNNTRTNLRFVTHSENIRAAYLRIRKEEAAALFDQLEELL